MSLPPYKITFQEYAHFQLVFVLRYYRKWTSWLIFLPLPLGVAAISYSVASDLNFGIRLVLSFLVFILVLIAAAFITQVLCMASGLLTFKTTHFAKGAMHVSLTDDQLISSLMDQEVRYKWSSLHNVTESKKVIFVFPDRYSSILIPKRIFTSPAEANTFLDDIRERWQKSKAK
ncbi:YcxB family protein [Asticcacaulis sp. SL142]|uniref:YcxB family protein n=1 Tax=Asticcacaulis sp. SL142 TaxID=2995155 RepID=UPI00226C954B|nr:YcxB family protein [Asticcacaulis sp. SL142]WAC46903.1 YcxB family protein [Asticcacaulis sp. SL142]